MELVLMGAAGICAVTDFRFRKIPNIITFPLLFISFGVNIYRGEWLFALIGFLVAFIIGFLGFATGHLGAGDVKLMAGIGAAVGLVNFLEILMYATIIGLLYGLVTYIHRSLKDNTLETKWIRFKLVFMNFGVFGGETIRDFFKRKEKYQIPFGLCLAVGLIINLVI